ncbi:MAG: DsbA family protein [Alphaproteobacteria bacterium]|nr:DsbA family protein [Alphaproteobacteria bacterium]
MDLMKSLKLAAGAAALFTMGAVVTAVALGSIPLSFAGGALSKAQVEQVVREYLLANPNILVEMSNRLEGQQTATAEKARTDALFEVGAEALFDPKVAYVVGPKDAKVMVAEFFDYKCPYCKASVPAINNLIKSNPNVRFAFIERPILSQDSVTAAQAAVASRRQTDKYIPFHNALMAATGDLSKARVLDLAKSVGIDIVQLEKDMADPAVSEAVAASNALANRLHFDGTPTFVINGQIVVGRLTDEELQNITKQMAPKS